MSDEDDGSMPTTPGKSEPTHVEIYWKTTYAQAVFDGWFETVYRLNKAAAQEQLSPEDMRVVFWFDN